MEKLRKKKKQKYKQNGRPFQQTRTNRISEHEHEIAIKGKTEELLVKQLKTCEKNYKNSLTLSKDQT
jgi:hypothetical protein